jgi:hypothetical protein
MPSNVISLRYHRDMPRRESESERTARLIEKALRTLPERDRSHVVTFLLRSWLDLRFGRTQPPGPLETAVRDVAPMSIEFTAIASSGRGHQTFPVRLPEEQHAALKALCAAHGFSMATVVRGLVEDFLRTRGGRAEGASG